MAASSLVAIFIYCMILQITSVVRHFVFLGFASSPIQIIIYVWFSHENTLRKAGARTDVYETFKRMLARGKVPGSIEELLDACI